MSNLSGSFNVTAPTNNPPTISGVSVVTASHVITWNAVDSAGVANASITVDNANVTKVYGPYTATSGVNYGADYGVLAAGTHNYVITVTDKAGLSSTYNGSFNVTAPTNNPPTISGVSVVTASHVITWNAVDSAGVAGASITVDNVNVTKLYGPYAASSGVNYGATTACSRRAPTIRHHGYRQGRALVDLQRLVQRDRSDEQSADDR